MKSVFLLMIALIVFGASPLPATTWHVPGDASTIQAGINMASGGDTVLVGCGTYYEHDIAMKAGVRLLSETGEPDCVTIDAQQLGRVIRCRFAGASTRIEGFTITGGHVPYSPEGGNGGGIYCLDNSSPWIVNCIITNNFSDFNGGGVCCQYTSSAKINNCVITANVAGNGGSGIRCADNSSATIVDCTISDSVGDGIWVTGSSPTITNCTISGSTRNGIYCSSGGSVTVTGCTFSSNSGGLGGGIKFWNATGTVTNCSFVGNFAGEGGGGIGLKSSTVTLISCDFTGNDAGNGGGIYLEDGSYLAADTTIFDHNTASSAGAQGFVMAGCEAVLTCCVTDLTGFAGGGTITLHNDGCTTPVEESSWGRIKLLYR
jgi:parallel beta-helix repeat protein